MFMRYAQIREMDIVNGVGVACSIFFQGCMHHCKDCFNKETWNFSGGQLFTAKKQLEFQRLCQSPNVDCVSFLGGEPLDQPLDELEHFLSILKKNVDKPFYFWSGYTMAEIKKDKKKKEILKYIDVLIDGEYKEELKDYRLTLRGSSNQNIWMKSKLGFWKKK